MVASSKKSVSSHAKEKKHVAEKKSAAKPHNTAVNDLVTIDRRMGQDRRSAAGRQNQSGAVVVERRALERRVKVNRRRQIDPTTCERDYTQDEIEFMGALDQYKRRSGRMFPTCSEVLEVIKSLGYVKTESQPTPSQAVVEMSVSMAQDAVSMV
ncbi:MAG: hypothetical protein ABFC77_15025 [Thermoguttaceae bacterium]